MPTPVEHVDFDSKLFGVKVGKIEMDEHDIGSRVPTSTFEDYLVGSLSCIARRLFFTQ